MKSKPTIHHSGSACGSACGSAPTPPLASAVALVCFLTVSLAQGQTTVAWDSDGVSPASGGSGIWDTSSALWLNGTSAVAWPNVGGTTGTFATLGGTAGTVTIVAGGVTVGGGNNSIPSVTVAKTGYTLTGGPLTVDDTGGGTANNNSAIFKLTDSGDLSTLAVDNNLVLKGEVAYLQLFNLSKPGQTGTFNGNLSLDPSVAIVTKQLQVIYQKGNVVLNGIIANGSGTAKLALATSDSAQSTLTVTGNNTFSGGILARKAEIFATTNTAFGTGQIKMNSGVPQVLTGAALSIGNYVLLENRNTHYAAILGGSTAHASTLTDTIFQYTNDNFGQPLLLTAVAGGTLNVSARIQDQADTLAIHKIGAGVVKLSSINNSYGSGTQVNVGTLLVNNTSGAGTGQGAITVNSAAASTSTFTLASGNTNTVTAGNTAGLITGQTVTGTNIPSGTVIARVNADGTSLVLSKMTSVTTASPTPMNFGAAAGTLGGTGIITGATTVNPGATIAPGDSTAEFTTSTLTVGAASLPGGTLAVEIDGFQADKLVATGPLVVTGAQLTVSLLAGGFTPGGSYVIAQGSPLTGTFASVPSGYTVTYSATQAILTVTPILDFNTWSDTFTFANPAADSLATADPDGDGVTNQQEYAFGLNPTLGSSVNPITVPYNPGAGTFTYTRRLPSLSKLAYTVQTSTTLASWDTDVTAGQNVTGTAGDIETVVVTLTPALLGAPQRFVRISAE